MGLITNNNDITLFNQLATVFAQLPFPVAIVDLETTGGNFEEDRITEIAILRFHEGKISRKQWLVNPQKIICDFIINLTGITNEMVQEAPIFEELGKDILPLLRGHLLVAHNCRFDYTFLQYAFARINLDFAALTLDTVSFSRKLYPQYFKHNLDSIIERFNIDINIDERHRAMGDVLALSQFLTLSLTEQSTDVWLKQWCNLIKPGLISSTLPLSLRQQIYTLPDNSGISIWQQTNIERPEIWVHEKAFSEIITKLQKNSTVNYWQNASMTFVPAVSKLHAYFLRGQCQLQQPLLNQANVSNDDKTSISNNWYTIQFTLNHHGQLQPHIRQLCEGILTQQPFGLYPHRQAAKRALAEWAKIHQLCPTVLDITSRSLKLSDPCPLEAAHQCDGHCRHKQFISEHNQQVLSYAQLLPVCGWGKWHEILITDQNNLTQQAIQLTVQAGCLRLDEKHWYFHPSLPKLIKQYLKKPDKIHFVN